MITRPGSQDEVHMHVFLSYSRRDAAFVGRLADDLALHGIEPWLDTDDLPIDDEDRWRRAVVEGIRGSDAVVLVLSPDSVQSEAVERELTLASELTRRIVPILHRACELSDGLMFDLAGLQRTDFVDQRYDVALGQLVQRIRAESHATATQTSMVSSTRRPRWPVVATVVSIIAALAIAGIVAAGNAGGDRNDIGGPAVTAPVPVTVAAEDPPGGAVGGDEPGSTSPGPAEPSMLVPWDEATAVFERRDGTTSTVAASSVTLACDTGRLRFENGQTISLEIVESVRFDSVDLISASAAGAVVLLDGRELTEPIFTWNCPVGGTTDLGPLSIELEDIRRIDFNR